MPPEPDRVDGRRFSRPTKAAIRRLAVEQVLAGASPSEVMRRYGFCRTTIYRWLRAARRHGRHALASRPHPGRPPAVSPSESLRVRDWIVRHAPGDLGFVGTAWTRNAVCDLVEGRLGKRISPASAGRLLRRIGFDMRSSAAPANGAVRGPPGVLVARCRRGAFLCEALPSSPTAEDVRRAIARLRERAGERARIQFRAFPALVAVSAGNVVLNPTP